MTPDIPQNVVVAGLVGCLLALVVATAQQQWRLRVFFLLALRLAIGWQFLSEGLNKIQSHLTAGGSVTRPFSSEPYFREAEGPLAGVMRSLYLDDPEAELAALTRPEGDAKSVGDVLGAEGLAAMRADLAKRPEVLDVARIYTPPPPAGTADLPDYYVQTVGKMPLKGGGAKFLAAYPAVAKAEGQTLVTDQLAIRVAAHCPPAVEKRLQSAADAVIEKAADDKAKDAARNSLFAGKWLYARWVLGLDAEATKKKYIAGDLVQTVPARLEDYEHRKAELEQLQARRKLDLGRSTLFARIAEAKADMTGVRKSLVSEAEEMIETARSNIAGAGGVPLPEVPKATKKIETLDMMTMWTLAIAGACLFFGLGTRVAAVVCGGFLLMTYLTYPPLPWLPNPPGTEGNPVFVNKNAIEMLACFALACLPTGHWMGIDALIAKLYHGDREKAVVI